MITFKEFLTEISRTKVLSYINKTQDKDRYYKDIDRIDSRLNSFVLAQKKVGIAKAEAKVKATDTKRLKEICETFRLGIFHKKSKLDSSFTIKRKVGKKLYNTTHHDKGMEAAVAAHSAANKHDWHKLDINEGKVHKVDVLGKPNGPSFKVFENPSREQMKSLHSSVVKKAGPEGLIRTLKSGDNHYVWDAHHAIHNHVSNELNINNDEDRGAIAAKHFPEHNFDVVKVHAAHNDDVRTKSYYSEDTPRKKTFKSVIAHL